jgi:hypothetical protein
MTFEVRIHDPKEPEKGLQNLGECGAPDLKTAEAFIDSETRVGPENIYLNRIG